MTFEVTFMIEGQKNAVQKLEGKSLNDIKHDVESKLKQRGFVDLTSSMYGDMFGETVVRTDKVIGYHITQTK